VRERSVLVLSWEVPPLVAGGSWTAMFHLVRRLASRGMRVTVATPWDPDVLAPRPFGVDVELVALDIRTPKIADVVGSGPTAETSPYGWRSPYPSPYPPYPPYPPYSPYPPYGAPSSSPYPSASPYRSGSPYAPYGTAHGVADLRDAFGRRLSGQMRFRPFDYVHAVDWITCDAAAATASRMGRPWVAHLHSIEDERNPGNADPDIVEIERAAITRADAVIVPSAVSRNRLMHRYGTPRGPLIVLPNPWSGDSTMRSDVGRFDSHRVVFCGRLTDQKGPDLFVAMARDATLRDRRLHFEMVGSGELAPGVVGSDDAVALTGPLAWAHRHDAFRGASAVVVPSRCEPFGMVIAEAMGAGVPVLFSHHAGAGEVLHAGLPIDPLDTTATATVLCHLLGHTEVWQRVVSTQYDAFAAYGRRDDDLRIVELAAVMATARP
jgi:glycosyltransferase involved in cell wall biosynthesis